MSETDESRADLARQLLSRVDRLATVLGDGSLATEVQLLKRELARSYDLLASPADNDYRSVLTLVEAALACLTWKGYTPAVLDALRRAGAAGDDLGRLRKLVPKPPRGVTGFKAIARCFSCGCIPAWGPASPHTLTARGRSGRRGPPSRP